MVKIKDIADAAGVSTATVSRVLSNKPHVRPEVKKRVMQIVQKMNYRRNRVAQNLRSNTSKIIALIVSDIENPFFQRVSRAVDDAAFEYGYSVILCNTDENPGKEEASLNLLRDENLAGVILSPTQQALDNFREDFDFQMPMVIIDRYVNNLNIDNVIIDNVQAARTLTAHLIEHGCQRIGGIFGMGSTTGRERHEGFMQALKDHNITPATDLIKFTSPKAEDGYNMVMKLLQNPDPPRGILTSNSLLAAGALLAIRESKLAIPDDIAMVSFDNPTWAKLIDPALTVIEQPTYEIGRTAAELLIKRIQDPTRSNRQVVLKTKLIVRQSC
ncbi:LacI family DNA-binding transcriptional regulator [Desulforhopalus vacuolatus]|uniref:LacI family DNA-binding transcriptional regulator n=1 Tax=Desulforhopalus vacuolatus TaxID=40414 RepID=UPI0019665FEB|nr:LacI family DNA-binding transcriptional regulator [Desulforhopalus vacuolatus]MBM9518734.1 LacI family DNA-binding transcriptional regulator [Desulforhopalus vacuolatus]